MSSAGEFTRPDAAKEFFSWEKVNLDGAEVKSPMPVTLTAGDWTGIPNPSYVDKEDGASVVVCSGLPHQFGDRVGVVINDTLTATSGTVACAGRFFMPLKTGTTPTVGEQAYWDVSAEEFINLADIPVVGTDILCGHFTGTAQTLAASNDQHLPARDYCEVELTPLQTLAV